MFWRGQEAVLDDAVRKRRRRVGWLAGLRVVAVLVAFGAVWMWAVDAALFLVTTGPGAAVLHAVADILGVIGSLPVVGAGLSAFLTGLVGVLVWAVGAAVGSLVGLIPVEIFRATWEANDATERYSLLSWSVLGWAQVARTYRRNRALPASQGLGSTKHRVSCKARKRAFFSSHFWGQGCLSWRRCYP